MRGPDPSAVHIDKGSLVPLWMRGDTDPLLGEGRRCSSLNDGEWTRKASTTTKMRVATCWNRTNTRGVDSRKKREGWKCRATSEGGGRGFGEDRKKGEGKASTSKKDTSRARLQDVMDNRRERPEETLWLPDNHGWMEQCPCGGGENRSATYRQCCEPLHKFQTWAPNPLTLARARYSAYVKGCTDFLVKTNHPMNPDLKSGKYEKEVKAICEQVKFTGFLPVGVDNASGKESFVTFIATFEKFSGPPTVAMEERSRYIFEDGRWWYRDAVEVNMR